MLPPQFFSQPRHIRPVSILAIGTWARSFGVSVISSLKAEKNSVSDLGCELYQRKVEDFSSPRG